MNNLIMYALKTIRYRSLIAEALLGNLSECEDKKGEVKLSRSVIAPLM